MAGSKLPGNLVPLTPRMLCEEMGISYGVKLLVKVGLIGAEPGLDQGLSNVTKIGIGVSLLSIGALAAFIATNVLVSPAPISLRSKENMVLVSVQ